MPPEAMNIAAMLNSRTLSMLKGFFRPKVDD